MSDFKDASAAIQGSVESRLAPRTDVYSRLPAVLPDMLQHIVTVLNISMDGLMFRFDRPFKTGERIVFNLPIIGRHPGYVIWCQGNKTGVQFEMPIDVRDYLAVMRALGATTHLQ